MLRYINMLYFLLFMELVWWEYLIFFGRLGVPLVLGSRMRVVIANFDGSCELANRVFVFGWRLHGWNCPYLGLGIVWLIADCIKGDVSIGLLLGWRRDWCWDIVVSPWIVRRNIVSFALGTYSLFKRSYSCYFLWLLFIFNKKMIFRFVLVIL
jgi:hypothetical protein